MGGSYEVSREKPYISAYHVGYEKVWKMIVLTVLSIIWIAYELGREDGNWGPMIALGLLVFVVWIISLFG